MKSKFTLFLLAFLIAGLTSAWAQVNVNSLGSASGWYSDDTRTAAGVVLNGTNSSFQPFFNYPEAPTPSIGNDALIAEQIKFGDYDGSTKGVVILDGTTENLGKSSVRYYGDGNGIGQLDTTFTSKFRWFMDPYPTSRTLGLNLLVVGSDDLTYSLSWVGSNSIPNTWNEFSVDANTSGWRVYDNGAPGSAVVKTLNDWFSDPTYGSILLDAEVIGQGFNIGSGQRNCRVGVDWLESSLLNNGDRIEFVGPIHNVTLDTYFHSIQTAIDAANAGDVIEVAAGTYTEGTITVSKSLDIRGANYNVDATDGSRQVGTMTGESVIVGPVLISASNVSMNGFYLDYDGTSVLGEAISVYLNSGVSDINISYNVFEDSDYDIGSTPPWGTHKGVITSSSGSGNVTLEKNLIAGYETAAYINPNATNVLMNGNKIVDCKYGFRFISTQGLSIANNEFESSGGLQFRFGWAGDAPAISGLTVTGNSFNNLPASIGWVGYADAQDARLFIDMSDNTFDGKQPASMTDAELFALEDKIHHIVDDMSKGAISVVPNNWYVSANSGIIQNAIDAATAGDVIQVAAGTFTEAVNLNKAVTLKGANAGIAAGNNPGERGEETILDGGVHITAAATIDGFQIKNGRTIGSQKFGIRADVDGIIVQNCIVQDVSASDGGIVTIHSADNLSVTNNTITNNYRGIYFNPGSGHVLNGNLIDANNGVGVGIGSDGLSDFTMTGNTISNHDLEGWGSSNVGTNVVANNNAFLNNTVSIAHYGGSTINADCNWWALYTLDAIEGLISDNVSVSTILLTDDLSGDCGQPWPNPVQVQDEDGIPTGAYYATLQEAIDASNGRSAVSLVNASPGVYNETVDINVDGLQVKSAAGADYTTIIGGNGSGEDEATVRFSANNASIEGFTIDNQGGPRAIGPKASDGTVIKDNIFINSDRGVQGDWYGRPTDLTIEGNTFQTTYGVAGTEDVTGLNITANTFETSEEGIGLGVGSDVADVMAMANDQSWDISGGYAVKDYRDNTIYVTAGSDLQDVIDNYAVAGDEIVILADYVHNGLRITINKDLTINGNNQTIDGAIDIRGGAVVTISNLTITGIQNTNYGNLAAWSSVSTAGETGEKIVISVRGTGSKLVADNLNINQVGFANANLVGVDVAQDAYVSIENSDFNLTAGNVFGFYLQNYNTEIDVDNVDFTLDPERDPVGLGNKNAIIIGAGVGNGVTSFPTIDITNYEFTPVLEGDQRAYKVQLYAWGAALTNHQINTWFDGLLVGDEKARVVYAAAGWFEYPSDVFNVTQGLPAYTIQEAIDEANANDVIEVAAGTYQEAIHIDKPLTLLGPNSNISPVTGIRNPEATITGDMGGANAAILIGEPGVGGAPTNISGVTIKGFEIANITNTSGGNACIGAGHNFVNYSSVDNVTIEKMYIHTNNVASGIYTNGNIFLNGWTITDNKIENLTYQFASAINPWKQNNLTITDNEITDIAYSGINASSVNVGIISGNSISNIGEVGIQVAYAAGYPTSNLTITQNTISQANMNEGDDKGGIRLYGGTSISGSVNITNNLITNSYNGLAVKDGEDISSGVYHVNENSLIGNDNFAVYHGGSGDLDAKCNYWGTTTISEIEALISGDVEYLPFLVNDDLFNPICGGGGAINDDTGEFYDNLQDAIDEAEEGETIIIYDPNFIVPVDIDKEITIIYDLRSTTP